MSTSCLPWRSSSERHRAGGLVAAAGLVRNRSPSGEVASVGVVKVAVVKVAVVKVGVARSGALEVVEFTDVSLKGGGDCAARSREVLAAGEPLAYNGATAVRLRDAASQRETETQSQSNGDFSRRRGHVKRIAGVFPRAGLLRDTIARGTLPLTAGGFGPPGTGKQLAKCEEIPENSSQVLPGKCEPAGDSRDVPCRAHPWEASPGPGLDRATL